MKFITLAGAERRILGLKKYLIKWEGKSRSKLQRSVKKKLKKHWKNHIVFEEFPVAGTRMTFDFYNSNKKIAIEVQGVQHDRYVPFFHGNNAYNHISQLKRDDDKCQFCELNDITLVEILPSDELTEDFLRNNGVIG